ncbi:MAG: AAA family ATPase [Colwellia sp.]|nr:AAA family ATPase [Colwellia sp.]MCW8863440.1 AAA family ATPase [Colwellia sp.]MCW9081420.1 AAA family ATPase [Colwellia sp.]
MYFKKISLNEWQQFQTIDIDFHERVTILTGGNGSGKTTILNILARHSGWNSISLATPKTESTTGIIKYFSRFFSGKDKGSNTSIGSINYSNNVNSPLIVNNGNAAQYHVGIQQQQNIQSFYIPSHRPIFKYQQVGSIPTAKKNKQSAFQEVSNSNIHRYQGNGGQSSSFFMKNTLIGWVIQGYGVHNANKAIMPSDDEQIQNFEGFQQVLQEILPPNIGFEQIEIRNMEVVFVCNGGDDEFVLETASGGISALIDIAWQIYMFSTKEKSDITVLIDEVENHLHPIMQRRILPDLVKAFPKARFVVSTHSPLVVGSVKDSTIYALKSNSNGKVESHRLDLKNQAKNAIEVLDEILGVSFTMPIWVEEKLNFINEKYFSNSDDPRVFSQMRQDLAELGLEKLLPHAIEKLLEGKQ